jgi:acetyl-CoA C-acetyltransferase
MIPDPSAPLIAGAAAIQQRMDDPSAAVDALTLMRDALVAAADDAGSRSLLDAATVLMLPQGTWSGADPATVIAPGNREIRTVVAEIGVLQQTLLSRAGALVASGAADIVLVCGGEAKFRALRSMITGVPAPESAIAAMVEHDLERLAPAHEIITREEIDRGLPVPARQYALIDTALRHHDGLDPQQHIAALAELQSRFSTIAAANPDAWNRRPVDAQTISDAPMLAWPYTKLHCSQWNVDQAAGLIICSATAAERHGVAKDRWVFAHLGVESNLMVPVTLRAEIHRSPAVAVVGELIRERLGVAPGDIEHLDLYSCFPAAVRVQVAELGIDPARQLTMTGGMTFAGGPLNNYTLQAIVTMTKALRADPRSRGLVTNVSGMLTKFGASVWSCIPPASPFTAVDVTDAATAATPTVTLDPAYTGDAEVITYTVAFDKGAPTLGIVIGDEPSGQRVLATTTDVDVLQDMTNSEWCGRQITVEGPTLVS